MIFYKRDFSIGDAFVGFHEDTIPSIVMQVCNEIEREEHSSASDDTEDTWKVSFVEMSIKYTYILMASAYFNKWEILRVA